MSWTPSDGRPNRLRRSPLYDLVRRHLVDLSRDADRLSDSPMALALGDSSTQLIRALLTGAAYDEAPAGAMRSRKPCSPRSTPMYDGNLRDPALSAAAVAKALAVSRRHLFRMCTQADLSLEQYIIGKRLEGAKANWDRLPGAPARSPGSHLPGASGPDPLRAPIQSRFGILPKDWRRLAIEEALQNEPLRCSQTRSMPERTAVVGHHGRLPRRHGSELRGSFSRRHRRPSPALKTFRLG